MTNKRCIKSTFKHLNLSFIVNSACIARGAPQKLWNLYLFYRLFPFIWDRRQHMLMINCQPFQVIDVNFTFFSVLKNNNICFSHRDEVYASFSKLLQRTMINISEKDVKNQIQFHHTSLWLEPCLGSGVDSLKYNEKKYVMGACNFK